MLLPKVVESLGCESIAVELVQSILGSYPDIAVLILTHIVDQSTRKPFRRKELTSLTKTRKRNCRKQQR